MDTCRRQPGKRHMSRKEPQVSVTAAGQPWRRTTRTVQRCPAALVQACSSLQPSPSPAAAVRHPGSGNPCHLQPAQPSAPHPAGHNLQQLGADVDGQLVRHQRVGPAQPAGRQHSACDANAWRPAGRCCCLNTRNTLGQPGSESRSPDALREAAAALPLLLPHHKPPIQASSRQQPAPT